MLKAGSFCTFRPDYYSGLPKLAPVVLRHEVGFNHLKGLHANSNQFLFVDNLDADEYAGKMLANRAKRVPFALTDEVTSLSILQSVRQKGAPARLVFSLATEDSVHVEKVMLPEFMLSILISRDDAKAFEFVRDAFWQIVQTDVELLGKLYAEFCGGLETFAMERYCRAADDRKVKLAEVRKWVRYTLRLKRNFLDLYSDQELPWKPVLERALKLAPDGTASPTR